MWHIFVSQYQQFTLLLPSFQSALAYVPHSQWEKLRLSLSIRPAQMGAERGCTCWGSETEFAAHGVCRQLACDRWTWAGPCWQQLSTHGTRSSWGPGVTCPGRDFQQWHWWLLCPGRGDSRMQASEIWDWNHLRRTRTTGHLWLLSRLLERKMCKGENEGGISISYMKAHWNGTQWAYECATHFPRKMETQQEFSSFSSFPSRVNSRYTPCLDQEARKCPGTQHPAHYPPSHQRPLRCML